MIRTIFKPFATYLKQTKNKHFSKRLPKLTQNPWYVGFLLTANRINLLYIKGSTAWFYDLSHQLSPLYIIDRCFDKVPKNQKNSVGYAPPYFVTRVRKKLSQWIPILTINSYWHLNQLNKITALVWISSNLLLKKANHFYCTRGRSLLKSAMG